MTRAAPPDTVYRLVLPPPQEALPEGIEPLTLWQSPDGADEICVDNMLVKWLRPHQREGVLFMFECVVGLRMAEGQGARCPAPALCASISDP